MRISLFTIFTIFMLISVDALALSCARLAERLIVECNSENCARGSYVYEIPMHGTCSRRPIVENATQWQVDIVRKFVTSLYEPKKEQTVYVLYLEKRWYKREKLDSRSALIDHFVSEVSHRKVLPNMVQTYRNGNDQKLLLDSNFYKQLNSVWISYTGRGIIKQLDTSYNSNLSHWKEVENSMLHKHRMGLFVDWGAMGIGASLLFASIYVFFRNLNRYYEKRAKRRRILIPVTYQFLLFSFSVYWTIFNTWQPNKLAGLGLIVVVLWLVEIAYVTRKSIMARRSNA